MKKASKEFHTDISFITLLVLLFICNAFILLNDGYAIENFVILLGVFIIVIITYFTSLTTGLIINTVVIMGSVTYLLVLLIVEGQAIPGYVYFWIFMMPALTIAFTLYSASARALQRRVEELNNQLVLTSTLDENTHNKNLRMFINDTEIKMRIARRYDIKFAVVVIRFRYQKEIKQLAHKEGLVKTTCLVVHAIEKAMRTEDELYYIEDSPLTLALILLTNKRKKGKQAIESRLKQVVDEIDTSEVLNARKLVLDVQIGFAFDDGEKNAMDLLEAAKDSLQYDV